MTAIQAFPRPIFFDKMTEDTRIPTDSPFRNVVLVADLSGEPSYALRYAQALAKEQRAKLLLVHSIDPMLYAFPQNVPASVLRNEAACRELAELESVAAKHGAIDRSTRERDQICEDVLRDALQHEASLLILGTVGKTVAALAAIASVARRLLTNAPCPILTITPRAESLTAKPGRWDNVLAATDFSLAGLTALSCAQGIARRQLVVLYGAPCGKEQECSKCMEQLRLLAPINESHTLPVEHLVFSTTMAGETIASYAEKLRPDLLVLGAPAVAMESDCIEDSTVYQAISQSGCPVLLVPAERGASDAPIIEKVSYAC